MPNTPDSNPKHSQMMYTSAHNLTNCHLSLHLYRVTTKNLTGHLSPYFSQQQSHPLDCDRVISQS
ncbi:hypothetical protein CFP56_022728 [Quercus suber]|uniref:Uncharacterized protein n=1 Tax=Quercus suber TaxID=58331 RepID=A0AAW0KCG2_QUESU